MTGVQALREGLLRKRNVCMAINRMPLAISRDGRGDGGVIRGDNRIGAQCDEVICFDPSYDSYAPAIALWGE